MAELNDEKSTGRIEAFSDGVFAIAITLLILDIKVPDAAALTAAHGSLASALTSAAIWPSYVAFFMSFAVILVMWVNHHRIFTLVRRTDDAFLYWNGLLMLVVTIVPFPTALLARYMVSDDIASARTAAAVYAAVGVATALAFTGLWRHAIRHGRLLRPDHNRKEVAELSTQYRYGPLVYVIALVAAYFSAPVSVGICLSLALFFSVRGFFGKR